MKAVNIFLREQLTFPSFRQQQKLFQRYFTVVHQSYTGRGDTMQKISHTYDNLTSAINMRQGETRLGQGA